MIIYIAGPITGVYDYREKFESAERELVAMGHIPINPAHLPSGLGTLAEYMHVCYPMINLSDAVYFMCGWNCSKGAKMEMEYAEKTGKQIFFQDQSENVV